MRLILLFAVGLGLLFSVGNAAQQAEVADFLRNDLANVLLGTEQFQTVQESFPSSSKPIEGAQDIARLSTDLGIVIQPYIAALGDLTREIELQYGDPRSLDGSTPQPINADDVNGSSILTYSDRLNTFINTTEAPAKIAPNADTSSTTYRQSIFASSAGLDLMEGNYATFPNLRYQYFASEDGFMRYYPAFAWDAEETYDPRLTSWYANSVAGPKTVVLLIRSGYDYGDIFEPFFETFSSKDFLQVVSYGPNGVNVSSCFDTVPLQMFRTSAEIKTVLRDFIADNIDYPSKGGSTNLTEALGAGFDTVQEMFNNPTAVTCLPTIIWVPAPSDKADNDLRLYVARRNDELEFQSRPAAVFVYENLYNEFSHRITCESSGEYYNYNSTENTADLAFRLARYYLVVAQSVRSAQESSLFTETAQFTFAHATFITATFRPDGEDLLPGLTLTLCQPAYSGRTLIGTVGLEVAFSELEARLLAERRGSSGSYIISNQQADTIVHPQVASSSAQDPDELLDLRFVEITPAFYNIRTSIVRLSSSSRSITVIEGSSEAQGDSVPKTYYWAQIPGVPMSVVVSRVNGESVTVNVEPRDNLIDSTTNYFVSPYIPLLDAGKTAGLTILFDPNLGVDVTLDTITYLLPPSLYTNLETPGALSASIANSIHDYLNDADAANNVYLTDLAKPITRVISTSKIQEFWLNASSSAVLSRELVFSDGTTAMYPGRVGVPATVDWRDFDWYIRSTYFIDYPITNAETSNNKITLTPPSIQTMGGPVSNTFATPVYHQGVSSISLVAVMAMELDFVQFWEMMTDSLPVGSQCRRSLASPVYPLDTPLCILIDSRVMVLGDPQTYDSAVAGTLANEVFLGESHPGITQFLLDNDMLTFEPRTDFVSRTQRDLFFVNDRRLTLPFSGNLSSDCASASQVTLSRVQHSSFFIVTLSSDYTDACAAVLEGPVSNYSVDVCAEISFTYRSSIDTENCYFPVVFLDSVLDNVRDAYAECADLGKYYIIDWIRYDDGLAIAFVTLTAITQFLIILLMIWVYMHQSSPVIRMASPLFCEVILFGCVFALCTIYFLTGEPSTNICRSRAWFFCLGFSLTFAALFAKTWRLHRMYLAALEFQNRPISAPFLGGILVLACLPTVLLLILWSAIDPLEAKPITDDTNSDMLILQCQSDNQWVWQGLLIAVNGVLVAYGCYVTIVTRKIRLMFNESRFIGLAIYNVGVFASLGIALGAALENNKEAWYAILCATILVGTLLTVGVLFLSKLKIHYLTPEKNNIDGSGGNASVGTGLGTTQAFNSQEG